MKFEFIRTVEGFVDVVLHEDLPMLSEALDECLGSQPPQGARQDGPSTYWIDSALIYLQERLRTGSSEPFAEGNVTYLRLSGEQVEARHDFDPEGEEVDRVPVAEFLEFLTAWRERVMAESSDADKRVPLPRAAIEMPAK